MAELTPRAIVLGMVFGVIFGAATVYLALKAGLTVSASIPIAVLAISVFKRLGSSTILENNIVQTIGSAGESIAAGVVFTLPGFLFLSRDASTGVSVGEPYFSYWTILSLALVGGILGVLMMIPLRRSLIVKEHARLPYPEGTACASVLIAGERGGDLARTAYQGLGFAFAYAMLQKVLRFIAETPTLALSRSNRYLPAAVLSGDITPEYLGVGYIIGPQIAGVLVAGGVLAWLGLIPLLTVVTPPDTVARQLVKLGYLPSLFTAGGPGGWDPARHLFADTAAAVYRAYVRQIGAGAVAAGGFITLVKTLPTIASSFKESLAALRNRDARAAETRTERDLPITFVLVGSAILVLIMALLPFVPGTDVGGKLLLGVLIVVFGFFFVTVASRIVGLIGSSSNPISGMTIATLMATCLVFVGLGWTGDIYQPMALCVGAMVCIAAANAGATSQDLKTGFLVGATPRAQQIGLLIGVVTATVVVGLTIRILDRPPHHLIGSDLYPAPQATLMATLIKGLLAFNLDWQYVMVGVALAATVELCGVGSLSFAVGAYLPLSTTTPVFVGGLVRGLVDRAARKRGETASGTEAELGPGNLFATGLVAGGAVAGVAIALLTVTDRGAHAVARLAVDGALTRALGASGYQILGLACFGSMAATLMRVARAGKTK
ncbi:MAG TPA: oligopeptide transporter, OPT family [Polyangia bacterium]|nr:oligopeptide transporter, OPT family [Polyangia bacterium]